MLVHGHHHPLHRHVQTLGRRLDDAQVGLVRDQPVQLVAIQAVRAQGFVDHRIQRLHRMLEDLVAGHQHAHAGVLLLGLEADRDTHRIPQQFLLAAVGVHVGAEDAGLRIGLEHHRAGAVAEQHAGAAIVPVQHPGQGLGADHQRGLRRTGADELVGDGQRVDEAGAGRVDVEGRAAGGAQLVLQQAGRGREDQVRRGGAEHDQVEVSGADAGRFHRAHRGVVGEVRGGLALGGDVALADAGAGDDPLVAGVHELGQVGVGQHLLRQVAAGTGDAGMDATFGLAHARTPGEPPRRGRPVTIARRTCGRPTPRAAACGKRGMQKRQRPRQWRGRASCGNPGLAAAAHSSSTTLVFGAMTCLPR